MTPDDLIRAADAWLCLQDVPDGSAGQFTDWKEALDNYLEDACEQQQEVEIIVAYKETTEDPGNTDHWEVQYTAGDSWFKEIGRLQVTMRLEVLP